MADRSFVRAALVLALLTLPPVAVAVAQVAMPEAVALGTAGRPIRETLATVPLEKPKLVTRVEMMRVDFPAHQAQGRHIHPVPVVCFIAIGRIAVKLAAQPEHVYAEGGVNVEPANHVVDYVRNLGDRPARQYCSFLAGANDLVLSRTLEVAR